MTDKRERWLRLSKYSHCFSVTVTPEMNARLLRYCMDHELQKTELCRRALEEYLNRQEEGKDL